MFALIRWIMEIVLALAMLRSVLQVVSRFLRGMNGGSAAPSQRPTAQSHAGPASGGTSSSASTLLHQDPICGTYVAAGSSFRKICNGRVVHFCSDECRDRYNG